ncbi:MAG: nucleotidyltransferase domain-containing protein [Waddliaceae bacterium]
MTEERYLDQLKNLVLNLVGKDSCAIFLFGGRARGRRGKEIDVDIGLLGAEPVPLELLGKLHEAVEASTIPLKVDFVDFKTVDESFKRIALTEIEIWNQPPTITIN